MSVKQFLNKNLVALIMVPMLVGAHYGWYKLQEVDSLVSSEDRQKLPFTRTTKNLALSKE